VPRGVTWPLYSADESSSRTPKTFPSVSRQWEWQPPPGYRLPGRNDLTTRLLGPLRPFVERWNADHVHGGPVILAPHDRSADAWLILFSSLDQEELYGSFPPTELPSEQLLLERRGTPRIVDPDLEVSRPWHAIPPLSSRHRDTRLVSLRSTMPGRTQAHRARDDEPAVCGMHPGAPSDL
jgi:hypothetical protein